MKQFDFERNWRRTVVPHLQKPAVVCALHLGLVLGDMSYRPGVPPWLLGRGSLNGQRARKGSLSWYQPWGRCHYIAPFCWALGMEIYPDLKWGFVTSDSHTVAIGYADQWEQPTWVMDILLFREKTAEESLAFAQSHGWKFYRCLPWYLASLSREPEAALEALERISVE